MSHEAEKQFSQTKGYRQGGIFSMINANDVTTFPPVQMGRGERKGLLSGITAFPEEPTGNLHKASIMGGESRGTGREELEFT